MTCAFKRSVSSFQLLPLTNRIAVDFRDDPVKQLRGVVNGDGKEHLMRPFPVALLVHGGGRDFIRRIGDGNRDNRFFLEVEFDTGWLKRIRVQDSAC